MVMAEAIDMPFADTAYSLLAKLHLNQIDAKSRIGLGILSIAILFLLIQGVGTLLLVASGQAEEPASVVENSSQTTGEAYAAEDTSLYVHITGEVSKPGMYELNSQARVNDAVEAAGGFTEDAYQSGINLARTLEDGEQIVVPSIEEVEQAQNAAGAGASSSSESGSATASQTSNASASSSPSGKVNINTADAETLKTLKGVGDATAEKIIADREANGPFSQPSDLMRVSGIGEKKFAAIKDSIVV